MLAKGMGVRQLATRIALYAEAKEFRSAVVVPGTPSASLAPGAPEVEPPMAVGHVGAAGAAGGAVTVAGVVVNVRPATAVLASVAETETTGAGDGAAAAGAVAVVVVAVVTGATSAGTDVPLRNALNSLCVVCTDGELATISTLACDGTAVTDGPAP
jgi:hypothetical protein